jgi:RNA polymerase sigma factor (sigma-70 family)
MSVIPFVRGGTAQARRFDGLLRPHVLAMYRFAYRLLRDRHDAEDLVQDVLTKLYPRTAELAGVEVLRPWLLRVVYRQFVDVLRRQRRRAATIDEDPAVAVEALDPTPGPEQQVAVRQGAERVRAALQSLNEDQRLLVMLHLQDGYTLAELAATLEVPIGTLKSRLHRAKAQLKEALGMEPFDLGERVEGHELP